MLHVFTAMKNFFGIRRRPHFTDKERREAKRAQVHILVDSICGWLHIIDPTKETVLRMFQNYETHDLAWRYTLENLKTAGDVFDGMTELQVTNDKVLATIFGPANYAHLREMSIGDAIEPLKHSS